MNEKNTPIVSVVMPVYNGEKCCERAIHSVLNQSYTNIELIVVNDGSKDGTSDVVQNIADKDGRVILINQPNGGVSRARNNGLAKASGDYVAFIDADDLMNEHFIETMLTALLHEKTDVAACSYKNVFQDGKTSINEIVVGRDTTDTIEQYVKSNWLNIIWNKLYRKNLISHLFNENKSMGEDLEFNVCYFKNVNSISTIKEPLYEYTRDTAGSLTKNEDLLLHAIAGDWVCLNELSYKGIESNVISKRMMNQIIDVINKKNDVASVKKVLCHINQDNELRTLINNASLQDIKTKVVRFLIERQWSLLLFGLLSLRK